MLSSIKISRVSEWSGKKNTRTIKVNMADWTKWCSYTDISTRPLIQNHFPYLSADDREFILNGVTPEEWDEAFPPEVD